MRAESLNIEAMPSIVSQPQIAEEELVRRTLSGDRDAFGELALRYETALFGHLRRLLRNREDAEELAQEALLRAYRALPQFRRHSAFGPWLFCIATNLARDAQRRRGTVTFDGEDELERLPDLRQQSALQKLEAQRVTQRLAAALQQLPPFLQSLLHLYYREEMKLSQIAEVFERDAKSIAVSMHRARERLRRILQSREGGNDREL